jgi:hypothetical protein
MAGGNFFNFLLANLAPDQDSSLPRDRLKVLRELITSCLEDSWYMSTLTVESTYR